MGTPFDMHEYKQTIWKQPLSVLSGFHYEKTLMTAMCEYEDLDDAFVLPCTKVFLFSGPEGYGKHTLARAFSHELNKHDFEFFLVDGKKLVEDGRETEILGEMFQEVLRATIPDSETGYYRKFYILFDHFELLCEKKENSDMISRFFELIDFDYTDYDCNCIIAAISKRVADVPASVRKYMNILELELPDEADRKEFFKNEFQIVFDLEAGKESAIPVNMDPPEAFLAKITEGFTYGELRKVVLQGKIYYKAKIGDEFDLIQKPLEENGKFLSADEARTIVDRLRKGKEAAQAQVVQENASTGSAPQIIYAGFPSMEQMQGVYSGNRNAMEGMPQQPSNKDYVDLEIFDKINEEESFEDYRKEYDLYDGVPKEDLEN